MRSPVTLLRYDGLKDLSNELLMENGKIKARFAHEYKNYKWDDFRLFCHQYARYGIPTLELLDFIRDSIDGRDAIEIGAGAGDLGHHLGIKMTDSKQQEKPEVIQFMHSVQQPPIKYPDDVEKLEALEAVYKYKPKVVVASWITPYAPHEMPYGSNPWGVKEDKILKLVETFIIVGNMDVHFDKPIRQFTHKTVHADWIISRAKNPENNCIFIWDKRE